MSDHPRIADHGLVGDLRNAGPASTGGTVEDAAMDLPLQRRVGLCTAPATVPR